jgi:hypothetical protein
MLTKTRLLRLAIFASSSVLAAVAGVVKNGLIGPP